jgi:hypothetical protein
VCKGRGGESQGLFLVAAYCVDTVALCYYFFALSDNAVYLLLLNHCNTYIHTYILKEIEVPRVRRDLRI